MSNVATVVPDQPSKTDRQLPDPENSGAPIAWLYKQAETPSNRDRNRVVGSCTPAETANQFRRLVILQTKEEWIVHCSCAGIKSFISQKLGDGNIFANRDTRCTELVVPDGQMSFWIGKQGTNVGYFRRMLDLKELTFTPDRHWEFRPAKTEAPPK